jgi:methionyl aminopeptidase
MIQIKTEAEIALMRKAGVLVGETLELLRGAVAPGVSTAELDALAEEHIRKGGGVPSFLGYHGFTGTICASVNDEIVHGIPGPRVLAEGDVISLDCGAIVDGWHGDAAITVPVGDVPAEVTELMRVCEESMWRGFTAARIGGRVSDISHAVESYIRSQGDYGIVEEYGGHGIGTEMHQDPHVLNHGKPGKGPRLVVGMALAIEPMITMGSPRTVELEDGWTVITRDASFAAHVEHTMALLEDGVWVTTAPDGGRARLGELVTARQPQPNSVD